MKQVKDKLNKIIKEEITKQLAENNFPEESKKKLKKLFNNADEHPRLKSQAIYEVDEISWILGYQQAIKDVLEELFNEIR